jgi:hypothetical protein
MAKDATLGGMENWSPAAIEKKKSVTAHATQAHPGVRFNMCVGVWGVDLAATLCNVLPLGRLHRRPRCRRVVRHLQT